MAEPDGVSVDAERLRILELLEAKQITAAEAAELLSALESHGRGADSRRVPRGRWGADNEPSTGRARFLRVRVTDLRTGQTRTNVSVPIGMVGFGLGFGMGFARRFRVPGVEQMDDVFEAVRAGRRGTVFDVSNEGGERVEILLD